MPKEGDRTIAFSLKAISVQLVPNPLCWLDPFKAWEMERKKSEKSRSNLPLTQAKYRWKKLSNPVYMYQT